MKEFSQLKEELLLKAKAASACADQYKRAAAAKDQEELLKVIYENLYWCINNGAIDHEYFSHFDQELYLASGIANTGKENIGFANSGDRNSGYSNSGDSNSGDRNSGDRNSGDRNSGSWNSGDRNSGDSNSGYRNSGAFCTENDPELLLFNKPSGMTVRQWEEHPAVQMMYSIDPTIWVPMSIMTDEEKAAHPKWETTEGYLKTISMHDAWKNFWHNLEDQKKAVFTSLPNFDAAIFEEITGIKI